MVPEDQMTWLAFDIGTTGAKAVLIGPDGRTIRSAYRSYATNATEGGGIEQDAPDWWQAVVETAQELNAAEANGIAITGQMQDVILLDSAGNPIRPVILYSDTRAHREAEEVNARIGAVRLTQITGTEQGGSSLLAKLLWLTRHEPENIARSAHLLIGAADYVALKMTGIAVTDTTTASTTGLLEIETRRWLDENLLVAIGIGDPIKRLPPVRSGGARVGTLRAEVAAQLGLEVGIPVHHGPGDAGATTLGAGSGDPGSAYAYIGTSGWVAFSTLQRPNPETGVFTLAHPSPERYITVAPLLTAGGNLDWAKGVFGAESHATMIDNALDRPPTSLIYLPYLNGERSPFSDPFARGAFIGLNMRHTREDMIRAVLEGVVFAYRHALETLIGNPIAQLTLTGGGTRSLAFCQLFADIAHLPVVVAEDAGHVGVRGAVLAAQVAIIGAHSYARPGFFPVASFLQPQDAHRVHYDQQYALFREAYPALKAIFARM